MMSACALVTGLVGAVLLTRCLCALSRAIGGTLFALSIFMMASPAWSNKSGWRRTATRPIAPSLPTSDWPSPRKSLAAIPDFRHWHSDPMLDIGARTSLVARAIQGGSATMCCLELRRQQAARDFRAPTTGSVARMRNVVVLEGSCKSRLVAAAKVTGTRGLHPDPSKIDSRSPAGRHSYHDKVSVAYDPHGIERCSKRERRA